TMFKVCSPSVTYTKDYIESKYIYDTTEVQNENGCLTVLPKETLYTFRTDIKVPKLGCMLVGWGGNNGSTLTAAMVANQKGMSWHTKEGLKKANYVGSMTQSSTVCIGTGPNGDVHIPFKDLLPMVHPNDIVFDGWDISSMNIADAMERARVLDWNIQKQLRPFLSNLKPRPSIYCPDFIAANQADRADNVLTGTKQSMLEQIRADIRDFKESNKLDKVIVMWTANTERFCDVRSGLNETAEELLAAISRNESEVSPSTIFAVASILEGCSYINGSPQNTNVVGLVDLAEKHKTYIGGDDFKTGQTKIKSVLVDFLVSAGIKPVSIVSYNHLGNNDGKNLSAPKQFRSKEISKSNVVDDMVESNKILYQGEGEKPDHCVVIKYVPYVGDSKRAMDEYTSEIFMHGRNTIVMHNTCEHFDKSNELKSKSNELQNYHDLAMPCSANGVCRACVGLKPQNHMLLEHKHSMSVVNHNSLKRQHVVDKKTLTKKHMNGIPEETNGCHMNGCNTSPFNELNGCR
ncbi:hypothetical protein QZH41_017001, partial [Actinostola sp. cb2023]